MRPDGKDWLTKILLTEIENVSDEEVERDSTLLDPVGENEQEIGRISAFLCRLLVVATKRQRELQAKVMHIQAELIRRRINRIPESTKAEIEAEAEVGKMIRKLFWFLVRFELQALAEGNVAIRQGWVLARVPHEEEEEPAFRVIAIPVDQQEEVEQVPVLRKRGLPPSEGN